MQDSTDETAGAAPVEPPYDAAAIAHLKAALSALQASGHSGTFAAKLLSFIISLLSGVPDTLRYKPPAVKETQTIAFLGRNVTFAEQYDNGTLEVSETPS